MKDTRTTTFGRPLIFNYLSIFNAPVCFNGDIICNPTVSGTLTVTGMFYPAGGIELGPANTKTMFNVDIGRVTHPAPVTSADNPTVTLNAYAGIITFDDVTLGWSGDNFRIDFNNDAISEGDLVFTHCMQEPGQTPGMPTGSICTSVREIENTTCDINVTWVGQDIGFTNDQIDIGFLVIGPTGSA